MHFIAIFMDFLLQIAMQDDDTIDICDTVSPFAVASLYHDMAKLLNIACPSSQITMTKEDKESIFAMVQDDAVDDELESVCEYIQKKTIDDITSMLA